MVSVKPCLFTNLHPLLILTKLVAVDPDIIACAMIPMQLLAQGGLGSKLLNRGSGWIRPTSCTPRFVLARLHALTHRDEARAGGP